jgi:hypothetical protein
MCEQYMRKQWERGWIAEIPSEISGAIYTGGNNSPSGGQARPLGEIHPCRPNRADD